MKQKYADGWHAYLGSLKAAPSSVTSNDLTTQYDVALMTLKAHEDKSFRGADIASLTIPWGQAVGADNCCPAGYHAVWSRDLYEVATALPAAGDRPAAERSLDYLLTVNSGPMAPSRKIRCSTAHRYLQACKWTRWLSLSSSPGS